jgi:putative oxidoreductase
LDYDPEHHGALTLVPLRCVGHRGRAMTAVSSSTAQPAGRGLRIALWVVQVLLALNFGLAGVMKSSAPIAELAQRMAWAGVLPEPLVRFIGVSELLGAIGLILPAATRIKPGLTPLAAAALLLVMVLAALFHISRGELSALPINATLGALAAFVAWGRWKRAPIAPRA